VKRYKELKKRADPVPEAPRAVDQYIFGNKIICSIHKQRFVVSIPTKLN